MQPPVASLDPCLFVAWDDGADMSQAADTAACAWLHGCFAQELQIRGHDILEAFALQGPEKTPAHVQMVKS